MAFLDELARMTSHAKNEVIQRTSDLSETGKLTLKLNEETRLKKQLLNQIGESYVRLHSQDYEPALGELMTQYLATEERIQGIQGQIREIKGIRLCKNCGAEVAKGSLFCQKCGTQAPIEEPSIPAGSVKCARCGKIVPGGMNFCVNCGAPMEPEADKRFCAGCGAELDDDAQFCSLCGTANPLNPPKEEKEEADDQSADFGGELE